MAKILTYENDFQEFVAARDRGELCVIDEEMYMYWLEVLPPVFMFRDVELINGRKVRAGFGFAEGAERVTAFWEEIQPQGSIHYAQHSTLVSRG